MADQDLSTNLKDTSVQLPNIADFLSPKLMQAMGLLLADDEGTADLHPSTEDMPLDPSFGYQGTPVDIASVDTHFFEVVAAEVAAAATHVAVDSRSPAVRPLERESALSATAKAVAFPLAAGAADVLASTGESDTASESAEPHLIYEDATANEHVSGGEWWW